MAKIISWVAFFLLIGISSSISAQGNTPREQVGPGVPSREPVGDEEDLRRTEERLRQRLDGRIIMPSKALQGEGLPERSRVSNFFDGLYQIREFDLEEYLAWLSYKFGYEPGSTEERIVSLALEQSHQLSNRRRNDSAPARWQKDPLRYRQIQHDANDRYAFSLGSLYGGLLSALEQRQVDTAPLVELIYAKSKNMKARYSDEASLATILKMQEHFAEGKENPNRELFAELVGEARVGGDE